MKLKTTLLILIMAISMLGSLSATTPALADSGNPVRMPRIVVFTGNGGYHTSVEGFRTNASFSVEYSDTLGPKIEFVIDMGPKYGDGWTKIWTKIWTNTTVIITFTVIDVAEDDEVVSGIDTVVLEYSTDGTTWTELNATVTGNAFYVVTMPTSFSDGDTIQVRAVATDKAGNEETSDPISYTVEAPPTTTTASDGPGFELFFGIFALFGIAVLMSHRKKR